MPSPGPHNHSVLTPTALVLTSHLLRHDNPFLSSTLKRVVERWPGSAPAGNAELLSHLQARTIGQILAALTVLGQKMLADPHHSARRIALLHTLLDEWIALAEWVERCSRARPERWH